MTIQDLSRVQQIDTELLLEVDRICKKNSIQYFLFYGTLLGAVRHSGPIPWDDDVDICMTRSNYHRFIEVAEEDLNAAKYNLKIMGSGSPEYLSEIKIGKRNTLFCMPGAEKLDIMKNVQLDIFCLDYIKFKNEKDYLHKQTIWKYLRLCKLSSDEKTNLKTAISTGNHRFKWAIKLGIDVMHIVRSILGEKTIEKLGYDMLVDPSCKSEVLAVVDGSTYRWQRRDFEGLVLLPYGDYMFPVPSGYDSVLKERYKDYMLYPPEGSRFRKNFSEWIFKEETVC